MEHRTNSIPLALLLIAFCMPSIASADTHGVPSVVPTEQATSYGTTFERFDDVVFALICVEKHSKDRKDWNEVRARFLQSLGLDWDEVRERARARSRKNERWIKGIEARLRGQCTEGVARQIYWGASMRGPLLGLSGP